MDQDRRDETRRDETRHLFAIFKIVLNVFKLFSLILKNSREKSHVFYFFMIFSKSHVFKGLYPGPYCTIAETFSFRKVLYFSKKKYENKRLTITKRSKIHPQTCCYPLSQWIFRVLAHELYPGRLKLTKIPDFDEKPEDLLKKYAKTVEDLSKNRIKYTKNAQTNKSERMR